MEDTRTILMSPVEGLSLSLPLFGSIILIAIAFIIIMIHNDHDSVALLGSIDLFYTEKHTQAHATIAFIIAICDA